MHDTGTDMKKLYKLFNELLGKYKQIKILKGDTDVNLVRKFLKHFHEKIVNIHNSFAVGNNRTGAPFS